MFQQVSVTKGKSVFDFDNIKSVRNFGVSPPRERGYHAACSYGAGLVVHGGSNSVPGSEPMSDWNVFDVGLGTWIETECFWAPQGGMVIPDKHFVINRKMHCMTTVYPRNLGLKERSTRLSWIRKPTS